MKRFFLCASLLLMCLFLAGSLLASEVELPRRMAAPPGMVLARVTASGDLVLRIIDFEDSPVSTNVMGYQTVEKTIDGVTFKEEKEPFTVLSVGRLQLVTGSRMVPIDQSVLYGFFDANGVPVTRELAAERLAKETAVVLSNEPVERFHLLTAKDDVLVLVIPERDMPKAVVRPALFEKAVNPVTATPAVEEPQVPRQISYPPTTALARMSAQGDLDLRMIDDHVKGSEDATSRGRPSVPLGWRKVSLQREGPERIFDTKGKPVTWENAAERLAKEIPILIHYERIDPNQLLTFKEDTLLVIVPVGVFAKKPIFAKAGVPPFLPVANAMGGAEPRSEKSLPPSLGTPFPLPVPSPTLAVPIFPKPGLVYLETGFAQATDNGAVVVKVVDYSKRQGLQKAKYEPVHPSPSGEMSAIGCGSTTSAIPKKWRLLALNGGEAGIQMHDRQGNAIPWEKARKLLECETPVLLSAAPIDPEKLSVMKDDALVLVLPPRLLYPDFYRDLPTPAATPFAKPTPANPSEPPLVMPSRSFR